MIQLVAEDNAIVLTYAQVRLAKYLLLEFIPATRVDVLRGPGVVIQVPGHTVDELAPGILAAVEDAVGCGMTVSEKPDPSGM